MIYLACSLCRCASSFASFFAYASFSLSYWLFVRTSLKPPAALNSSNLLATSWAPNLTNSASARPIVGCRNSPTSGRDENEKFAVVKSGRFCCSKNYKTRFQHNYIMTYIYVYINYNLPVQNNEKKTSN